MPLRKIKAIKDVKKPVSRKTLQDGILYSKSKPEINGRNSLRKESVFQGL